MPRDGSGRIRAGLELLGDGGGEASHRLPVRWAELDEAISGPATASAEVGVGEEDDPVWWQPDRLLGRSARLLLWRGREEGREEAPRRFCGLIRGIERVATDEAWVRLRLAPAFASLDEQRLTRPFVRLSAVEILRQVLAEHLGPLDGRAFELRVSGTARGPAGATRSRDGHADRCDDGFPRRDLCVQYGETTYDFCRRLMAEEGLASFFEHDGPRERLVVVGGDGPFERRQDPVTVAPRRGLEADTESVFSLSRSLGPAGTTLVGVGDVLEFAAGRVFVLAPSGLAAPPWLRDAAGDGLPVLLTRVRQVVDLRRSEAETRDDADLECAFQGVPASGGFRPPAIDKPRALEDWGIVASDDARDPIDADPLGRARVAFLYDRRPDARASDRSPPVPVSQAWAGDGYGAQVLPRAGMLARVEYLGGDPDRPVIAACVPTGQNRLPAPPPAEKTRLTIRTRDLRAAAPPDRHRNELALDDAPRAEQLWIRAGRDHVRRVLHDEDVCIDHDEARLVEGAQRLHVAGNRCKLIESGERARIGGTRRAEVGGEERRTVAMGLDGVATRDALAIDGRAETSIVGPRSTSVGGEEAATFHGGRVTEVEGDAALAVKGIRNVVADGELWARQGGSTLGLYQGRARAQPEERLTLVNDRAETTLDASGSAALVARAFELRCGSSSLSMGRDGIVVRAPAVVVASPAGRLTLDAGGATLDAREITSSAVVLNAIRGACVIFSDTPGNFSGQAADTSDVRDDVDGSSRGAR